MMNEFKNGKCDVVSSSDIGRYVVAVKPLKQGDLLLCEQPVIIGLNWGSDLRCLACYKGFSQLCNKCQLAPLCCDCEHEPFECNFLATASLPKNFLIDNFDVVTALRFIMLSRDPSKKQIYEEVMRMESHCAQRCGTPIWITHENCVTKPLKLANVIGEEDAAMIQKYCGIMDVNAFEIRSETFEEVPIRGLYPKAALLSHDCVGNTFISLDETRSLRIYSSVDIDAGKTIYNNYTFALVLSGTEVRRQHLKEGKYFHCKCSRCMDPTELQTNLSSLNCQCCEKGLILYQEMSENWQCNVCKTSQTTQEINGILTAATSKMVEITTVENLEQAISIQSKLLNPNHYLVIDMKQRLASILRNICDRSMVPQPKMLRRKIELCEDILPIIRILQPGIARLKAIALFEYFNSKAELTIHEMNDQKLSISEGIAKLASAEQLATESIKMLLYEPKSTPEGHLAKIAMLKLKSIRENISLFRNMLDDGRA
ncbi:SET domain-containing protein SmydA-8-like [Bradysia coprophila]|uniref:SET domain-containing protein SmydA-8-like n=1 Tax=Bradysia coprophila TaxID=38358 RepID=UPI00187D79FF|nr:SET domain-containing protein SmydA-8-like [Bradysia coprophila]